MPNFQAVGTILWEGDVLSESEWRERLDIDDSHFRLLVADGIFRVSSSGSSIPAYRLDLVGLLFTRDHAFTILPKIFRDDADTSAARDVIACVRIYLSRIKRRLRHASASEILSAHAAGGRTVDILLALIDWTLDRGFHSEDFEAQSEESFDIDWVATIDHNIPLHVGGSVIYSELIGKQVNYQLGPLAHLQAEALLALHRQLRPASLLWLDEHDPILDLAAIIAAESAIGGGSFVSSLDELIDYLSVCNRDHDRELANILFDWLKDVRRASVLPNAFGTTAFQFVWEDMCEVAVSGLGESLLHKDIASQPSYCVGKAEWSIEGQRPDILRRLDDDVYILDAKWYDIGNHEWPGTQDVIKQIMYQATVVGIYRVRCNAFLVPVRQPRREPEVIGEARLMVGGKADARYRGVGVIAIPWHTVVAVYCGVAQDNRIANAIILQDFAR